VTATAMATGVWLWTATMNWSPPVQVIFSCR
jgi:hypothetical protein